MNQFKNIFVNYKRQFLTLGLLIPLLVVGVFLALNPTAYRPKAAGSSLKLDPTTVTKQAGEEFAVSLIVDPAGKTIVAAEVEIKYDPTILSAQVTSLQSPTLNIALKKVDTNKGIINLAFASYDSDGKPSQGLTTAATLTTIPFKAIGTGTTNVTLGKSKAVDSTGTNILENSFAQTVVSINGIAAGGIVTEGTAQTPTAVYTFSSEVPKAQEALTIKASSKSGKVDGAAIIVNATSYSVRDEGNNTYSAQVTGLQNGKHIIQLVGGCKVKANASPDCSDAQIGFNPYQLNIGMPSSAPQAVQVDATATFADVIANWGRSGKGDANGDGVVDSTDFAILYRNSASK